jgi:hypothetical protein
VTIRWRALFFNDRAESAVCCWSSPSVPGFDRRERFGTSPRRRRVERTDAGHLLRRPAPGGIRFGHVLCPYTPVKGPDVSISSDSFPERIIAAQQESLSLNEERLLSPTDRRSAGTFDRFFFALGHRSIEVLCLEKNSLCAQARIIFLDVVTDACNFQPWVGGRRDGRRVSRYGLGCRV